MSFNFAIALVCSILLHMLILFALIKPLQEPTPKQKAGQTGLNAELVIPPEQDESAAAEKMHMIVTMLKSDQYYKEDAVPINQRDEAMCKDRANNYVGVGIMIQPGSDKITSAPHQYPAYRAGMREGDTLIDPFGSDVTPDGYIDFTVWRNKELIKFHIKAENICFKKAG